MEHIDTAAVQPPAAEQPEKKKRTAAAAKKPAAKKTAAAKTKKETAAASKSTAKTVARKKTAAKSETGAEKKKTSVKKAKPVNGGTLIIVESPTKVHTIEQFLSKEYHLTASQGHIADLPSKEIGVDIDNGFMPKYITMPGKEGLCENISIMASGADRVLLATDPDREGEAISWHIAQMLGIDPNENCRIEFNEITSEAVKAALQNPRPIDLNLVNAQQSRRILDRLVGYKISPLLWRKVRTGLSAGRVQSVALRMVCDRDREIERFVPVEYWSIEGKFKQEENDQCFSASLEKIDGKKKKLENEEQANAVCADARNQAYVVQAVKKGKRNNKAPAPFTTSTLQQEASRRLSWSPTVTMRTAQSLYEGVDLGNGERSGLITYMRTDSVRVSAQAIAQVREYIAGKYGKEYLPARANHFSNRSRSQDAHEAIRPTMLAVTPAVAKNMLSLNQYRLYEMIYQRFVASQMAPEVSDTLSADIVGGPYLFRATGSIVRFEGYRAAYADAREEDPSQARLPELIQGQACSAESFIPSQHFTQPPAHYNDGTLVKALEERGIGRPSTYASIISTIIERQYVVRTNRQILATDLGYTVTDWMTENFADIVDETFTAQMESQLDDVEEGGDWQKLLTNFYDPFSQTLETAAKSERVKVPDVPTDIPCENCGTLMVIKSGRFGKFLACPNYPACKTTKPIVEEVGVPCPKCGAKVIKRKSKRGKVFFGCEKYPVCDYVSWDQPVLEKCAECGGDMVLKYARNKAAYHQCLNNTEHKFYLKRRKTDNSAEKTNG